MKLQLFSRSKMGRNLEFFCILLFCLAVTAVVEAEDQAPVNESIDQFDKEFGILEDDAMKKKDEANLKKAEAEINAENEKYKEGKSEFYEKLNSNSEMSKEEFESDCEGLVPNQEMQTLNSVVGFKNIPGLLPIPERERNDPVNRAKVDAMYASINRQTPPSAYDSREYKLVTPPKNQRTCGSCAAFASVGLIETCMLKTNTSMANLDLSEQHLVDCAYNPAGGINGCNGATLNGYPQWFKSQGGVGAHENLYPYQGNTPTLKCPSTLTKWNTGSKVADVIVDYWCNEEKLKTLVSTYGAVSVGMNASSPGFSNYGGGIYSGCPAQTSMNHAVVVVGYGESNGSPFWLVKNSWGTGWGEGGYFRIKRGSNMCGIGDMCVVATCTGGLASEPAPTPPPPPPIPASLTCDVSHIFGPITGSYRIRIGGSGLVSEYTSLVTCTNGVCQPYYPEGITNCCVYMCGEVKC